LDVESAISVTDATGKGAALFREALEGHDVIVERHKHPIAVVVGIDRFESLRVLADDLRSASVVMARMLEDDGTRNELDEVIREFGFSRAELEAELEADLATGRE
jgi:antitoxin (DNA-binding transcriptional repressor) of toxin-antitoxin stability system